MTICPDCGGFFDSRETSRSRHRRKCPGCADDAETADAQRGPYEIAPRWWD